MGVFFNKKRKSYLIIIFLIMVIPACSNGQEVSTNDDSTENGTVIETESFTEKDTSSEIGRDNSEDPIESELSTDEKETEPSVELDTSTELETTIESETPDDSEQTTETINPLPTYTYIEMEKIMYANANVNIRDLPSTEGNILGQLSQGAEIKVTGQCTETKWYRIEFGGRISYVSNNYLQDSKVNTETININKVMYVTKILQTKSKPSINAPNNGYVMVGTEQWVMSEQNGWYAIRDYDGSARYIQTKYMTDDPTTIVPPKADADDEYYVNWNGHILLLNNRYTQEKLDYKYALAHSEYGEIVMCKEIGRCGAIIPRSDSISHPYASEEEYKLMKNKISNALYREAELQGYIIGDGSGGAIGGGGNFDANRWAYLLEVYFIDPREEVVEWNGHDVGIYGMNENRKEYIKSLAEAEYFTVKFCNDRRVCCGIVIPDKSYLEQGYSMLKEYVAKLEHYGVMEDEEEDSRYLYRDYAFDTKTGAWIIEFYYSCSVD